MVVDKSNTFDANSAATEDASFSEGKVYQSEEEEEEEEDFSKEGKESSHLLQPLRQILNSLPSMHFSCSSTGHVEFLNRPFSSLFVASPSSPPPLMLDWPDIIHPLDFPSFQLALDLSISSATAFSHSCRLRCSSSSSSSSSSYLVEALPHFSSTSTPFPVVAPSSHPILTSWFGTVTPIAIQSQQIINNLSHNLSTTTHQLQAIQKRCDLFQLILDKMPVGVVAAETSGKFIYFNSMVNTIWGFSTLPGTDSIAEYSGYTGFHSSGERYKEHDWPLSRSLMHGEVVVEEETRVQRGTGDLGYFSISSQPIHDANGDIVLGTVMFEDITEKKQLQEERANLMASERAARAASAMKTEFLANVSHEIRTPLTGMLGTAELMLSDHTLTSHQRESLATIRNMGNLLLSALSDILDLSRVESGTLTLSESQVDIAALFSDIQEIVYGSVLEKGLSLSVVLSQDLPRVVFGDGKRLKQLFLNLVLNAVKFTNEGSISVSVSRMTASPHICRLRVAIQDTGIGMDKKTQALLFRPFTQADQSNTKRFVGLGLGLAICNHLVGLMDGSISVDSAPGKGSTFYVILDLKHPHHSSSASSCSPSENKRHRRSTLDFEQMKLLIVDDNNLNQTLASRMLQKIGIPSSRISLASNGKAALDQFKTATSGPPPPFDLIFMDCQMPVMDGFEATREIRRIEEGEELEGRVPIVALTASTLVTDKDACRMAGMDDHVSKPFTLDDLKKKLLEWL